MIKWSKERRASVLTSSQIVYSARGDSMDEAIICNEIISAVKLLFIISAVEFIKMGLRKLCGFAVFFPNKPKNVNQPELHMNNTHKAFSQFDMVSVDFVVVVVWLPWNRQSKLDHIDSIANDGQCNWTEANQRDPFPVQSTCAVSTPAIDWIRMLTQIT